MLPAIAATMDRFLDRGHATTTGRDRQDALTPKAT